MKKRKTVVSLELILLIVSTFAFSYIIAESMPSVSAMESVEGCCGITKEGKKCATVDSSECSSDSLFAEGAECTKTSFCQKGCCYDNSTGIYDKNVLEVACDKNWIDDPNCNAPGAKRGCCVLNDITFFETEVQCEVRTKSFAQGDGVVDWRSDLNIEQCAMMSAKQIEGACVLQGNTCNFGTEASCYSYGGDFYENRLCTSPLLNTSCEPTEMTACVDGKDGVYFLDSCGNIANIYDSSRAENSTYWDLLIPLEESCGYSDEKGNANSTSCGNCDRFLGGICRSAIENKFEVDMGNSYCKDTSCFYDGKTYENGESWCIYDGTVAGSLGDGKEIWGTDIVGSRHWRAVCNQGEVNIEPCADFRQQVCGKVEVKDYNETESPIMDEYESVACVMNRWRECADVTAEMYYGKTGDFKATKELFKNWDENMSIEFRKKCEDIGQCVYYEMELKKTPTIPVCMPMFAPGLEFYNGNDSEAEKVCSTVSLIPYIGTCTKITLTGDCSGCVSGCDCGTGKWLQEANAIANAFGDCGAYVNIIGDVTDDGYLSTKGKENKTKDWVRLSETYLDSLKKFWSEKTDYNVDIWYDNLGNESLFAGKLGIIKIGGGTPTVKAGLSGKQQRFDGPLGEVFNFIGDYFGWFVVWADIMYYFGRVMEFIFGNFFRLFGINLIGMGDCGVKKTQYHYMSLPWQPISGGDKCGECNVGSAINPDYSLNPAGLKPCSEYRCKSLGAACELINAGTGEEMCHASKDNGIPPIIDPYEDENNETENSDVGDDGFRITDLDGECLDAYTALRFGVVTNELAQCKFDIEMLEFNEMEFNLGSNAYVYNHTTIFTLPDPSHGESQGENWTGDLTFYIKCRDTFGHETPGFYTIDMCVKEGEDATAPIIRATYPENNAVVSFDATERDLMIITNELATCKWSFTDADYSLMENSMECTDELGEPSYPQGYVCTGVLPTTNSSNKYYIRCGDQPWLENKYDRNYNTESFVYTLRKPLEKISIKRTAPENDFETSTEMTTVDLKVETGDGGDTHICSYSFLGYDSMFRFFETGENNYHIQPLNLPTGQKKIYIECYDETGDFAQNSTEFAIIRDTSTPAIARAWQSGGSLYIVTTEDAECRYSTSTCRFNWDDGLLGGTGMEHTIDSIRGETYYVKCEDEFGNSPSDCSIIIQAL